MGPWYWHWFCCKAH